MIINRTIREKNDYLYQDNIKNVCFSGTSRAMKRQYRWEEIFVIRISNEELKSRIYKKGENVYKSLRKKM